ncbi:hypothetical protein, partial [Trinickia mobilis]|uniref:hypothetical protein n=1 Tax=Trinickia mobilis TaxID=2816356 RepID=UPI001A8CE436
RLGAGIMPGLAGQSPDYRGMKIVTGQSCGGRGAPAASPFIYRLQRRLKMRHATKVQKLTRMKETASM